MQAHHPPQIHSTHSSLSLPPPQSHRPSLKLPRWSPTRRHRSKHRPRRRLPHPPPPSSHCSEDATVSSGSSAETAAAVVESSRVASDQRSRVEKTRGSCWEEGRSWRRWLSFGLGGSWDTEGRGKKDRRFRCCFDEEEEEVELQRLKLKRRARSLKWVWEGWELKLRLLLLLLLWLSRLEVVWVWEVPWLVRRVPLQKRVKERLSAAVGARDTSRGRR